MNWAINEYSRPTIYALSSGSPPAGIAVVRISGPKAGTTLKAMTGSLPSPRRASYCRIVDPATATLLDHGLALWFPGPATATGEDLAELHLHGAIATVEAVLSSLARQTGLVLAEPGQFTRRALENGRIDLAAAEGLADLLRARTEYQRRSALRRAEGGLGQKIADWEKSLLQISAGIEATLDFADEGDVEEDPNLVARIRMGMNDMAAEIVKLIDQPPAEPLMDGIHVVLAGPPNAGKSTLLNALVGREAAIVDAEAGTTRDVIEVGIVLGGFALLLSDTAGLREHAGRVEQQGIARAQERIAGADILVWLGDPREAPRHPNRIIVQAQGDLPGRQRARDAAVDIVLSARSGAGMDEFVALLLGRVRELVPADDAIAINRRQRHWLVIAAEALHDNADEDLLILAEQCRVARRAFDSITGRSGVEDMLDALFGQFCIGK